MRGIDKVSFTGSTRAGAAIMENIARTGIKPMTLELGGKSPQVVFADADLDLAADCIERGILPNAGQVCIAGSRILVEASSRRSAGRTPEGAFRPPGARRHAGAERRLFADHLGPSNGTHRRHRAGRRRPGGEILCGGGRLRA